MKKKIGKLTLSKETILRIDQMHAVRGGEVIADPSRFGQTGDTTMNDLTNPNVCGSRHATC